MKALHSLFILLFIKSSFVAQVVSPYFTGFDTPAQLAGWTLSRKGDISSNSWMAIAQPGSYSGNNDLFHFYPVGGTLATNDWYVSPAFDFSAGGSIDSVRTRFSGFGMPGAGDTVAIYLLKGSANPSAASARILLKDFRNGDYVSDDNWNRFTNINIPAQSGPCYLAFRYYTVNNWLDVRFDNLRVRSSNPVGIVEEKNQASALQCSPVPAQKFIRFSGGKTADLDESHLLSIYDPLGRKIFSQVVHLEERTEIDFVNGIYLYTLENLGDKSIQSGRIFVVNPG